MEYRFTAMISIKTEGQDFYTELARFGIGSTGHNKAEGLCLNVPRHCKGARVYSVIIGPLYWLFVFGRIPTSDAKPGTVKSYLVKAIAAPASFWI
jgi:hypothetical protein